MSRLSPEPQPGAACHRTTIRPTPSPEEALALLAALAGVEHERDGDDAVTVKGSRWAMAGRRAALRSGELDSTRNRNGSW